MKLAFTSLLTTLSSYLNNMAIFCLLKNSIFDNSNLTRGHISLLEDYFHHNYDIEGIIRSIDKIDSCYIIISIYYFYEKNFVKCKLAEKVSSESCI